MGMLMNIARLALLAVGLLSASTAVCDNRNEVAWEQPDEDDLRMLEVRLDHLIMDEVLLGYQSGEYFLVGLGGLCNMLGIGIEAHPEKGTASGFILRQNRRFFLDAVRGESILDGRKQMVDPARVRVYPDDVYVDATLIPDWLPLQLDIDLYSLQMRVHPTEPLPLQQRMRREQRITRGRNGLVVPNAKLPRQDTPPALWSPPLVDQRITFTTPNPALDDAAPRLGYQIHANGELLFLESSVYLDGNDQIPLDDYRITLGRHDTEGRLLGPLGATGFSIGHIDQYAHPLVSVGASPSPGVAISNFPLQRQNFYDYHSFQGDLPSGWDVELYRNNSLIDYQPASDNGRYHFSKVPLLLGHNFFRLVFYGPEGQQREEAYHFFLGNGLTQPGSHYFRFQLGGADTGGQRLALNLDFGLSRHLSLRASGLRLPLDDGQEDYGVVGLSAFGESVYGSIDIAHSGSGSALEAASQTRLGALNLSARSLYLDDFVSEAFPQASDPLRQRDMLSLNGIVLPFPSSGSSLSFSATRSRWLSGKRQSQWQADLGYHRGPFLFRNTVQVERTGGDDRRIHGHATVHFRFLGAAVRNRLEYAIEPTSGLTKALTEIDIKNRWQADVNLRLSHALDDGFDEYGLRVGRRFGNHLLAASANYAEDGDIRFMFDWRVSFGKAPGSRGWFTAPYPLRGKGIAAARVYLDENGNGRRDDDEEPLENVRFSIGSGGRLSHEVTAADGSALISQLRQWQPVDISIAEQSLDDPAWIPASEGVSIVPRPGHIEELELAAIVTGEIDGTVRLGREGGEQPAAAVELELVDAAGTVVMREKSAFDGFYLFSKVPFGQYTVRVAASQLRRLGVSASGKEVMVNGSQPIVSGTDLILHVDNSEDEPPGFRRENIGRLAEGRGKGSIQYRPRAQQSANNGRSGDACEQASCRSPRDSSRYTLPRPPSSHVVKKSLDLELTPDLSVSIWSDQVSFHQRRGGIQQENPTYAEGEGGLPMMLVTLSENKLRMFAFLAFMLLLAGWLMYRAGRSCPTNPQ